MWRALNADADAEADAEGGRDGRGGELDPGGLLHTKALPTLELPLEAHASATASASWRLLNSRSRIKKNFQIERDLSSFCCRDSAVTELCQSVEQTFRVCSGNRCRKNPMNLAGDSTKQAVASVKSL